MISATAFSTRRLVAGGFAAVLALTALTACGGDDAPTAESWCGFVDESEEVNSLFDTFGTSDKVELEKNVKEIEGFIDRLRKEAPKEISDDANILASGTQDVLDLFKDADYVLLDVDAASMEKIDLDGSVQEAGDRIDVYSEKECGRKFGQSADSADTVVDDIDDVDDVEDLDPNDPDSPVSTDPAAVPVVDGSLRDQLITQFESIGLTSDEAGCIADNLDFSDPDVQSGDVGSMMDVFKTCNIDIARLAEIGGS